MGNETKMRSLFFMITILLLVKINITDCLTCYFCQKCGVSNIQTITCSNEYTQCYSLSITVDGLTAIQRGCVDICPTAVNSGNVLLSAKCCGSDNCNIDSVIPEVITHNISSKVVHCISYIILSVFLSLLG